MIASIHQISSEGIRAARVFAAASEAGALLALALLLGSCTAGPAPQGGSSSPSRVQAIPSATLQLVTGVSESWNSPRAQLQLWERSGPGQRWEPVLPRPVPALLGRSGSGWGRGLLQARRPGDPVKREGDGRAPAGAFALGSILGNDPALPPGSRYPYRQVTRWDTWIDDVNHPLYNQHVVVDPRQVPAWYESQKMRQGDFAYRWLVDIRHNRDQPVAGAGSAIFFHVRRGPDRFTSGCTTMAESDLQKMVTWLRAEARPAYVLLPLAQYEQLRSPWNLP